MFCANMKHYIMVSATVVVGILTTGLLAVRCGMLAIGLYLSDLRSCVCTACVCEPICNNCYYLALF